ncbi:MAG TPA: hypothetical protein VHG53_03465 [Candidatus Limnocylindria bacterium]|nr:hypothetical protein [Candidatus Limnocylindria bacterium]
MAASWTVLDEVAAAAPPSLRKGPRGGGRDRGAVVRHVAEAELAYARKLGLKLGAETTAARRAAILGALRASTANADHDTGWPVPYAARRIAWHVLDHAWEIEDRTKSPRPTSSRSAKTRKRAPNR